MLARSLVLVGSFVVVLGLGSVACSGAKTTELDDFTGRGVLPTEPQGPSGRDAGATNNPKEAGVDDAGGNDSSVDEETSLCDDGLSLTSSSAFDAAKAIGLCKKAAAGGGGWGLLDARFTKPDGTPIASANADSWGLLPRLGPNNAPSGKAMLALSSGAARAPGDPGYQAPSGYDKNYTHGAPTGQPKPSSVCTSADSTPGAPHDGVALELKIRVPASAKSLSFTHQLFTSDYGDYVCSQYNDVFVVLMDPKPGNTDGNIVFDALGNPLSVNSTSLLRACAPGTHGDLTYPCPLGTASLAGTGFEDKASTGWLRTSVPVQGGSDITLRFAIWDSGDGILDSTVLLDELAFSTKSARRPRRCPAESRAGTRAPKRGRPENTGDLRVVQGAHLDRPPPERYSIVG